MEIKTIASGSGGNCHYITDGHTPLLLDCGIGYRQIQTALNFKARQLHGCLVTHEHQDHAKATGAFIKSRIPVFMTAGTRDSLKLTQQSARGTTIVEAGRPFPLNTWSALPFETYHDAAEPVGYLLASTTGAKLLYVTDTHYVGHRFQGITHLMIEANYCEGILQQNIDTGQVPASLAKRLYSTHLNLRRVKAFLAEGSWQQLQEIHLLHLSNNNADAAEFKYQIESLTGVPVTIAGEVKPPEVRIYG